jgi:peptidoglycan-N-acetylglucosamine deacetylase
VHLAGQRDAAPTPSAPAGTRRLRRKRGDTPEDLLRFPGQFPDHDPDDLQSGTCQDVRQSGRWGRNAALIALGVSMAEVTSDDDQYSVTFVNRRRVLLAVGGIVLTSVPAARLGLGRPAMAPARHHIPAKRPLSAHHDVPVYKVPSYPLNQPLYYISDASKAIALTIDDGPDPVYTPQVLRVLHKYNVTATFSMIGEHVAAYPQLARTVAEAGHEICNHTWTHSDLVGMRVPRVRDELTRASDAIQAATGVHPVLFRAPYGAWSPAVIRQCERMKMVPLDWSVDPRDWARPGVSSIVRNIMQNTQPGSIILEHDGGGNRSETVEALRIVLPRLLDEGYHFETVASE